MSQSQRLKRLESQQQPLPRGKQPPPPLPADHRDEADCTCSTCEFSRWISEELVRLLHTSGAEHLRRRLTEMLTGGLPADEVEARVEAITRWCEQQPAIADGGL